MQVFGTLMVLGLIFGGVFAIAQSKRFDIPKAEMRGAVVWSMWFGLLGIHTLDAWVDHPQNAWNALKKGDFLFFVRIWDGMSAFGGFLGAILALWIYTKTDPFHALEGQSKRTRRSWLRYGDPVVEGLVVGWTFGRLGCALVHDHPGRLTSFFLGVRYSDGVRHDLGLYEFLFTSLVLLPSLLWLRRKKRPTGFSVVFLTLLYAPVRFGLDFLRANDFGNIDRRYWNLTSAQWLCAICFALALRWARKNFAAPISRT